MPNNVQETIIKQGSWWSRRSSLERSLLLTVTVCAGMAVALAVALIVLAFTQTAPGGWVNNGSINSKYQKYADRKVTGFGDTSICLTPECVAAASTLLSNMNSSVDPCEDFYEFACGNFERSTKIPDDKFQVNIFTMINDELHEQLRALLEEEPAQEEAQVRPFTTTKLYYKSCMDTGLIEQQGASVLLRLLRGAGGWPVLEGPAWRADNYSWVESVLRLRQAGYKSRYMLDFAVSPDMKNSTLRVLSIDQPNLGLDREYLVKGLDEVMVSSYFQYMVDVAILLGANQHTARDELMASFVFETELANMSTASELRRNYSEIYHASSVGELARKYPSIPWRMFFSRILENVTTITDDEVVIDYSSTYLKNLEDLLKKTPARVQANYLMWRVVSDSVTFLHEALRDRLLAYAAVGRGMKTRVPRWKKCIDHTNTNLHIALGAMYVRRYFDETSKQRALEVVNDIRSEYRDMLINLDWMDPKSKAGALDKADSMVNHIGYPQELMDDDKITKYQESLVLHGGSFLEAQLSCSRFSMDNEMKRLREPINRTEWISHGQPAVVNAFYNSIENSIILPAGILQGVFFSSQKPRYMNYGAIGFIIGHEISHGFDDQGSQFDKEGNLANWWADDTKMKYLEKAQCIVEQYGNYTDEAVGLKLNGINTQGENVADNTGIKEVYQAYLSWVQRNGEEPGLPGLPYSPKQLFWLSAANVWCSVQRPQAEKQQLLLDPHAPGRFRVLGPLSNMPHFSHDYNCGPHTNMNRKHKCSVW